MTRAFCWKCPIFGYAKLRCMAVVHANVSINATCLFESFCFVLMKITLDILRICNFFHLVSQRLSEWYLDINRNIVRHFILSGFFFHFEPFLATTKLMSILIPHAHLGQSGNWWSTYGVIIDWTMYVNYKKCSFTMARMRMIIIFNRNRQIQP